jgi:feruloyl esterase
MKLTQALRGSLLGAYTAFAFPTSADNSSLEVFKSSCADIVPKLNITNATIYFSEFVAAGTNLTLDNNVTCTNPSQVVPVDVCRIALYVSTSNRSGINMEAWLPSNWTGRFLSTGNGGLAGCIGYGEMAYATGYGFASVGANNGQWSQYAAMIHSSY